MVSDQLRDPRLALLPLAPAALVIAAIAAASGRSTMSGVIAAMEYGWEQASTA